MLWLRRFNLGLFASVSLGWGFIACSGDKFDSSTASGGMDAGASGTKNHGGGEANGGNAGNSGTGATAGSMAAGGVAGGGNALGGNGNEPSGGAPTPEAGADQGGAGPVEVPISLDGLVYWFKADEGVHLDSGGVALWEDQSGNGYDATQSTGELRPTRATTNLLPLPIVNFDGADDYLNLPTFTPPLGGGLSFFIVTGRSQTSDCRSMLELSNGSEINDIGFASVGNGFQFEVQDNTAYSTPDVFPQGAVRLIEVIQSGDPVAPMADLRVNGDAAGSGAVQAPVSILRTDNYIGRSLYANCQTYPGGMGEVILYGRALGVDERVTVENYLKQKWQCCN